MTNRRQKAFKCVLSSRFKYSLITVGMVHRQLLIQLNLIVIAKVYLDIQATYSHPLPT